MRTITKFSTVFVLLFLVVDLTTAALIPEESDAFNGKAAAEFIADNPRRSGLAEILAQRDYFRKRLWNPDD